MRWLVLLALLPACIIYDGGDDAIECEDPVYVPYELLDPATLVCQDFGGTQCGPVAPAADQLAVPIPTWGECDSPCRDLDEGTCLGTSGCRGAYEDASGGFLGCYAVDQSGPVQGPCDGLDAWSCSQHDDCIAMHDGSQAFVRCLAEMR